MKVAKKLEAMQSRFLWGDEDGARKYRLVKWEDVKKPVIYGGLGIKSLTKMNEALQWLWTFLGLE